MGDDDKFFRESYYNIIRILLSISGLWPYHTERRRYAMYFSFLLVFGSGMIFQILGVIEVWMDSLDVFDCISMLLLSITSLIKLIHGIGIILKIKVFLMKIQQYWYSLKSSEETRIFHSYVLHGRNLSYVYIGFITTHFIIFIIAIFLTKFLSEKPIGNQTSRDTQPVGLIYNANYMVDMDMYYVPIFLHTAICNMFYTFILVTFDVLYMMLTWHCCGLLAALRYRLENALEPENDDNNFAPISTRDKTFANMAYSIRRHAEVIQFASFMESIHRIPLFVHIGTNVLVLSCLGFQVITNTVIMNRMKHLCYLNALLLNTFFQNWPAQMIMDSSMKVYESAYNVKWYKMQTKQRKLLLMIMMRSKKPLTISAGKFVVLSYVTFVAMIRTAMSYFMLLRSVN